MQVAFLADPLLTHFVRQTQLSWRLLRRLAFVTFAEGQIDQRLQCLQVYVANVCV